MKTKLKPLLTLFIFIAHFAVWGQDTCGCKEITEKNQNTDTYNYTSLKRLFPYEDVTKELDYLFIGGNDYYNKSFARSMTSNVSHHSNATFYSFRTVNFNEPLKIMNNDSSLLLNLTPCKENDRLYSIQTTLYREFPTRARGEEFDSTAYSFFRLFVDVLQDITRSGQYVGFEIYRSFLHDKFDYNSLDSLNHFIREINEKQGFTISIIAPEIDGDQDLEYGSNDYYVNELIREIEGIEDFDFVDYLFTKFVLSTSGKNKINETEEKKLAEFLSPYLRENSHIPNNFSTISLLNRYLEDRYKISFSTKIMSCEITPQILRAWDEKKNRVLKETTNNAIAVAISMCFQTMLNFNMNSINGKSYAFQNSQLKPSEIYNTGVIVSASGATGNLYLNEWIDHSWDWDIMEFFKNDSISYRNYYNYIRTNLRGIDINTIDISIPFKKKHIIIEARDFWVNNNLVTFRIKVKNEDANKMRKHILKLGFDGVRIIKTDDSTELVVVKEKKSK
jgi:hypothetical protein